MSIHINILFVEDDPDDVMLIQQGFTRLGFTQYSFCANPTEAFEHLETLPDDELPTLIVCDYYMGSMNGLQMLHQLKGHPRYENIPVFIYTGFITEELKTLLQQEGAVEVVKKDFDVELLGYQLIRFIELA